MISEIKRLAKEQPATTGHMLVVVFAVLSLGGAWYSEIFVGLIPCPLCLEQRIPWYIVSAIAALALLIPLLAPHAAGWRIGTLLPNAGLLLWSAFTAGEHVGVEKGWWGSACTLPSGDDVPQTIEEMMAAGAADRTIPCDAIQWEMFGVTMAQLNLMVSLGLALTLIYLFMRALHDREA